MEEIEVKFLKINVSEITAKLEALGAEKVFEKTYRRKVFDYPDFRLNDDNAWVRIRDEGDKTTLSYKKRLGTKAQDGSVNDTGMEEIELEIGDFDKMALVFERLGMILKFYEENRRTRYIYQNIEFDIDTWPELNPYLEIEAESWADIDKAITLLGLNPAEKKILTNYQIYKMQGIDPLEYKVNTFEERIKR